ncbi:MAG TPA: FxsA family protein [Methylocystis sp.]|nr:FxsA family protein [Methylocystis sp.]HXZ15777.1 FxsA family protein [Roseiarcus sp.]
MAKSKLLLYLIGGWIALEALTFVIVVHFLGIFAAVALGVGTTILGLFDVKRLLDYLRARFGGSKDDARPKANAVDGGLQALGAVLLILPGFASDLVGLALKAPSIRSDIAKRLNERPKGPRTIDLAPTEWKAIGPSRRRRVSVVKSGPPTA